MLNYCVVKQRIGAIAEDDPFDNDRYPDYRKVSGDISFTPILSPGKSYQIVDSEGVIHTAPALRINAKIVNGEIKHEGETGVHLFAAGPNSNPPTIAYNVIYSNLKAGSIPVTLGNITFEAIPGATIDLATATPIAGTPGVGITKGDKGDPFIYDDFTPGQLEDLKGDKGDKGDPFIYDDFTSEQLEGLKGEVSLDHLHNNLGDVVGLLAGWTADMRGGRNLSKDKEYETATINQTVVKTADTHPIGTPIYRVDKLTNAGAPIELGQRFSIAPGETFTSSVLVKDESVQGSVTVNMLLFDISNSKSIASSSSETLHDGWRREYVSVTNNTNVIWDRIASYLYANRLVGEVTYFTAHKRESGDKATDWTPALEDAVDDIKATGTTQSTNPLLPIDNSLALRLDTTVGTRVFAGDTMIYGDTGWRDIGSLLPGSTGSMLLRRTGDVVEYAVNSFDNTSGTQTHFTLPDGYRVGKITHTLFGDVSPSVWVLASGSVNFGNRAIGGSKHVVWTTSSPWPTTLPGIPA